MTTDSTPTPAEPLKPCPMCGGPAEPQGTGDTVSIRCRACDLHLVRFCNSATEDAMLTECRAAWNRRATPAAAETAQPSEITKLRAALLECARMAEALKRECGMDPESPQAVRNAQYQSISTTAHIALGTIRGPAAEIAQPAAPEPKHTEDQLAAAEFFRLNPSAALLAWGWWHGHCQRAKDAATQAQPAARAEVLTLDNAPLGTKAPAIMGGHWTKVAREGWKWCTGDTFPRPGGDWTGELIAPATHAEMPKCEACSGRGEVGGLRPDGYHTEECPCCKGSGLATQASAPQVVEPTGNPAIDAWSGPVLLDAATPQASAPSVQPTDDRLRAMFEELAGSCRRAAERRWFMRGYRLAQVSALPAPSVQVVPDAGGEG